MPMPLPDAVSLAEQIHGAVLRNSGYAMVATNRDGLIVLFNRAAEQMLGYSASEVVGQATPALFHLPEELAARAETLSRRLGRPVAPGFEVLAALAEDQTTREVEWSLRRRDGSILPVWVSVSATLDGAGEIAGFLGIAVDISRQRESELRLAESETRYRALFEENPNPMLLYSPVSLQVLAVNDALLHLYGYRREEVVGASFQRFFAEEDRGRFETLLADAQRNQLGEFRHLWQHCRKDGQVLMIETSSRPQDFGGQPARLVVFKELTEQIEAETRADNQARFLESLLEALPTPVFYKDAAGRYLGGNSAYFSLLGIRPEDYLGKTAEEISPPELAARYRAADEDLMAHPERHQIYETQLQNNAGERRDVVFQKAVFRDRKGEVAGLIGIIIDVTERRAVERALRESEIRLKTLIESAPFAISVMRVSDNTYADVNQAFVRLVGYSREQLVGRRVMDVGLVSDPSRFALQMERLLSAGRLDNEEFETRAGNGQHIRAVYSCRLIELGGEQVVLAMAVDVSAQREAEAELRRSEERFSAIFRRSPVAMAYASEVDGFKASEFNGAWFRLFGYEEPRVQGHSGAEFGLWADPEERQRFIQASLEAGGVDAFEALLVRQDGTRRLCCLSSRFFSAGEHRLFLATYQDVTESRRIEQEIRDLNATLEQRVVERTEALRQAQASLVNSEKLAALGELVAGIAHELNTPIGTSVTVASTLLDRTRELGGAVESGLRRSTLTTYLQDATDATDILLRNLRRAAELVSSFKQVAVDQTSSQRRRFQMTELVQEILLTQGPALRKLPYCIDTTVPEDLVLDSFPGPLGQVLANLINNAIVHGFDGRDHGTIRIEAEAEGEQRLCLRVSDDGRGIPPENLKRIFDPFFTTRLGQGGSGLGLHIVYNIVTGILGGTVSTESALGQGTVFTLSLPRVAPRPVLPSA